MPASHGSPRSSHAIRRVGVLDAGALADVSPGGWVHTVDGVARIGWAIGAEDRWHHPDVDASGRSRSIESMPVIETRLRIPGGEAVAASYGALIGSECEATVVDVANESTAPVALAILVVSDSAMTVADTGVSVGDRALVSLTRSAARFAVADDVEGIRTLLAAEGWESTWPGAPVRGVVALVAPLPHTAHAVFAVAPSSVPVDRALVPAPDRVVAGWEAVVGGGPTLDLVEGHLHGAFRSAAADLRLGPGSDDPTAVCRSAAARSAVGDPEGGWPDVVAVARLGRGDGRIGGRAGAMDRTAAFAAAVVGAVSGGLDPDAFTGDDSLVATLAGAAHWLSSRRRSFDGPDQRAGVYATVSAVPRLLRMADQSDAAAHLLTALTRAFDGKDVAVAPRWRELGGQVSALGDWSDPAALSPPADFVENVVSGVARLVPTPASEAVTIDVLAGWSSLDRGRGVEAHGMATIAGRVSIAARWHGDRPALLWECRPWPGREPLDVVWRASRLDPSWTGSGPSGESLLSVPGDDA